MAVAAFDLDGLTCSWDVDLGRCCPNPEDEGVDADVVESALRVAATILMRRSGFTVGQCTAALRPIGPCPICHRRLCCGAGDWLHLDGPLGMRVDHVTRVAIGPDEVPGDTWNFDPSTRTLWAVPPMSWPAYDEAYSPPGAGDAFTVEAVVGNRPDAWALDVAAVLACELTKSCRNEKCRLPRNATQVTGQGVTVTLSDAEVTDLLPEVSAWVASVNPYKATLPGKVWSPDITPADYHPNRPSRISGWRGGYGY